MEEVLTKLEEQKKAAADLAKAEKEAAKAEADAKVWFFVFVLFCFLFGFFFFFFVISSTPPTPQASLDELHAQEKAVADKIANLEKKSQEGGVVSRNKAKAELEQVCFH